MKRINVLWLALVLVVVYVALNSITKVQAQQQPAQQATVRVNRIDGRDGSSIPVTGRVVGFSCSTSHLGGIECFVATTD